MEDIRRMEDETQKELETVRLHVLWKFSNFLFLVLCVCLVSIDLERVFLEAIA